MANPNIPDALSAALAGDYDVIRELGEGGMAVVYLATDLKHNREVAIKVLKSDLAAVVGAERFLGEIETTAKLQHPNILPLFDSGAKDGFLYYAMPYVEGETLRERLKRESQLPVEDALDLIQKVAAALDYAHEKGIVHRDIKPANILLSSGEPLIADFGIALAVSQANDGRRTETGLSLGTPHYMSPEQAAGDRSLDPRSDVYALGCILQEMLTGEPPFSGANAQAVLARILTSQPTRVTSLRPTVPPHVEGVIAKALEKLPADRFRSAKDFRKALSDTEFRHAMTQHTMGTGSVPVQPAPVVRRGAPTGVVAALGGLAAVALLAAAVGWLRPAPEERVRRFDLDLDVGDPEGVSFGVSPQGDRLAYINAADRMIYVRDFSSLEDQQIPGSFEGRGVVWSPDGTAIAFTAAGGAGTITYTAMVGGGTPIPIGDNTDTSPFVAWGADGYVYYLIDGPEAGVARAPAQGGPPEFIATEQTVYTVHAIAGETGRLLVSAAPVEGPVGVLSAVMDTETGELRPIQGLGGTYEPQYAGGYLFWVSNESQALVAARFDLDSEEVTSVPVTIGQGLGFEDYTVSAAGVVMHFSGDAGPGLGENIGWVDGEGRLEIIDPQLAVDVGDFDDLRLSPDGRYLAYEIQRGTDSSPDRAQRIQIYDLESELAPYQLSFEGQMNSAPRWMPDFRVAYLSDEQGATKVFAQPFDRSGSPELFLEVADSLEIVDLEAGPVPGAPVIVTLVGPQGDAGLFLYDPARPEEGVTPFVDTPFDEFNASISSDGRWVAYTSDENSRDEVFVRAFPEGGRPWPVAGEESYKPVWTRSGDDLVYLTDNAAVVRGLTLSSQVAVTGRRELFGWSGLYEMDLGGPRSFDIGPDGRLLVIAESNAQSVGGGDRPERDVVVIFNVFREIEERLAQLEAGR